MQYMNRKALRSITRYLSVGFLAAATLAFAQDADTGSAAPPPQPEQQSAPSSGGWRRVGDGRAEVYVPNQSSEANQYPQYAQYPAGDPNQSAPQGSQPTYNQQGPPQTPAYGQRPNYSSQPNYNQQNQPSYNQQNQPQYSAPPPIPAWLTIQQGTYLTVRVNQMLSSDHNQPGDAFTATLVQPVVVNGVVVAEPGQTLGGRVVSVQKHHVNTPAKLGIQLINMSLVDGQQVSINTQFISRHGSTTPGGQEFGTVAGTTALGAAIGAAAGWGTGAAIGAGAGAAAGLIGVLVTHNHASVIHPEEILTFQLEAPVTVFTEHGQQAFRYVQPNEYDRPYDDGPGPGAYQTQAPPPSSPPYYGYAYPYGYSYPYYAYAYPYWGPSFAFYYGPGYWWGGHYHYPYYGHGWNVHGGYAGGHTFQSHGTVGAGHMGTGVAVHGGGGHR